MTVGTVILMFNKLAALKRQCWSYTCYMYLFLSPFLITLNLLYICQSPCIQCTSFTIETNIWVKDFMYLIVNQEKYFESESSAIIIVLKKLDYSIILNYWWTYTSYIAVSLSKKKLCIFYLRISYLFREFLTGFRKRKNERRKKAQDERKSQMKIDKKESKQRVNIYDKNFL